MHWILKNSIAGLAGMVMMAALHTSASAHDEAFTLKECLDGDEPCVFQRAKKGLKPGDWPGPAHHFNIYNDPLATFDLSKDLKGMVGRQVRVRYWVMEPGGYIGYHKHNDRPAYVYLISGRVKETKKIDGTTKTFDLIAPLAVPESNGTEHWWVNETDEPVTMVAVDIPSTMFLPGPTKDVGITAEDLSSMYFVNEYPLIPKHKNVEMRGRVITFEPDGTTMVQDHTGEPRTAYVLSGSLLEHRSDTWPNPVVRQAGDVSVGTRGVRTYWQNISGEPAKLFMVDFIDCGDCDQAKSGGQ